MIDLCGTRMSIVSFRALYQRVRRPTQSRSFTQRSRTFAGVPFSASDGRAASPVSGRHVVDDMQPAAGSPETAEQPPFIDVAVPWVGIEPRRQRLAWPLRSSP
jgi:hypothetical protein